MQGSGSARRPASSADLARLLFSDTDDQPRFYTEDQETPERLRKIVKILSAKLPLGPFHRTVVPFPPGDPAAPNRGHPDFFVQLGFVAHMCSQPKADAFFSDTSFALTTAKLILAYLQYWHSYDSWCGDEPGSEPSMLHREFIVMMLAQLLAVVMHGRRRALMDLLLAHGIGVFAAVFSDPRLDWTRVLPPLDQLLSPSDSAAPALAAALWRSGAVDGLLRYAVLPPDTPSAAVARPMAARCAMMAAEFALRSNASVCYTDEQLQLLNSTIRCVLDGIMEPIPAVVRCLLLASCMLQTESRDQVEERSGHTVATMSVRQGSG
eukprot:TRINITY_DN20300_c0_g1_i1.p1 TRINITY_DN20300_c0_g1~~TRINITY_DN20300_c0_g1_i1.p1  ORF type:complete len:322 (-),score=34.24 TRINITY_DN20300_c0_g1_i1:457-1422(-)